MRQYIFSPVLMFVTERDINKKESTLIATFLVKKLFLLQRIGVGLVFQLPKISMRHQTM